MQAATATPATAGDLSTKAEDVVLWLPSAVPAHLLPSTLFPTLRDKERRLRTAQADDALEDIRRIRRILTGITEFRRLNVTGTGLKASTRVRQLYTTFQAKITRAARRYRAARAALVSLDPTGDWTLRLKVLNDQDLRGPRRDDDYDGGEGHYESSWIWLTPLAPGQAPLDADHPDEFATSMRVEWAQLKARAERWEEEVALLQEEMRRVVEYLEWKARWWRGEGSRRPNAPLPLRLGLRAYAEKQAAVLENLAHSCACLWVPYYKLRNVSPPPWTAKYDVPEPKGKARAKYWKEVILRGAKVHRGQEDSEESDSDASDSETEVQIDGF